ncbi:hypothetical protein C8R42DRAFT_776153 [Lentinula raphanica]|nr:hypothetical protein C8R42DRAFT_776153 [Lentinula raphanica]
MITRVQLASRVFGRQVPRLTNVRWATPPTLRFANSPLVQCRGVRTRPEMRMKTSKDEPTAGEKILVQRMLEQRQLNIFRVAQDRAWFFPSEYLEPPSGWSYEWPAWVAGWELVPIVDRSQNELVLEHFYGLAGRITPILFRLDPFAPDFVFRYGGINTQDNPRKGTSWKDQGSPGAYYYFRMGNDELFRFSTEFDSHSPEHFIRAFGSTELMMEHTSVVPVLPEDVSTDAFSRDCDLELVHFEERVAALDDEEQERRDPIVALAFSDPTEEPLHPITHGKILALREKYESYKSYGVYSVYSLIPDVQVSKDEGRSKKQLQYLRDVEDFERRVGALKKELDTITDDEGEFEVVRQQSGRQRIGAKKLAKSPGIPMNG